MLGNSRPPGAVPVGLSWVNVPLLMLYCQTSLRYVEPLYPLVIISRLFAASYIMAAPERIDGFPAAPFALRVVHVTLPGELTLSVHRYKSFTRLDAQPPKR